MASKKDVTSKTSHQRFGGVLSDTIISPGEPRAASIRFGWSEVFAGECTLGGNLIIFDDGHAEWHANVRSREVGEDSWGSRFRFYDIHNVLLWEHGWIWSPTLSPTPIEWHSLNQIFFAAYIFPHIALVNMEYHC